MPVPFTRLEAEARDSYGSKNAFDLVAQSDGIVAYLGSREAITFEDGGQPDFRERLMYGYNTNIGHRGKGAQIPTIDDEGFTLASVPQKVLDGSIVYNQIELDQVRGNPAIAPGLIADKIRQFNPSWVRNIAIALRQATPGANDPYSILPSGTTGTVDGILVARTPAQQVSDAATTAGILRSETVSIGGETIRWWANQYSNTSFDLTTVAGRRGLHLNVYLPCVRGAGKLWEPDFGIAHSIVLSSLGAGDDALRRYSVDDRTLKLGFENIVFHNATVIRDPSARFANAAGTAAKIAFFNSRALKLKVLRGTGKVTKEMMTEDNNLKSLPIFWKNGNQAESDIDSLNWVSVGYLCYNIVPMSLMDHGLADNCT